MYVQRQQGGTVGGGYLNSGDGAESLLIDCVFSGNTAPIGAGLASDGGSSTLINSRFVQNAALFVGGGCTIANGHLHSTHFDSHFDRHPCSNIYTYSNTYTAPP